MFFSVPEPVAGIEPLFDFVREELNSGIGRGGFIAGRVFEKEIPVSRRVLCYHRRTGNLVHYTYSDIDGNYRFDDLEPNANYFVVALDENNDAVQYNAVVQDLIAASTDPLKVIIYPDGPIDNGEG